MIKTNKKLALLLALLMLMTMFAGLGTASAAGVSYQVLTAPIISADVDSYQQLGKIRIDITDVRSIAEDGEWLTIQLSANCEFDGVIEGDAAQAGLDIDYTNLLEVSSHKTAANMVEIKVKGNPSVDQSGNAGNIFLDFKSIKVKSGSNDVEVAFSGPGIFSQMEQASVASIGAKAAISVKVDGVKKISDMGGYIDSITITESRARLLKEGDTITFRLAAGFSWKDSTNIVAAGGWAFEGYHGMGIASTHDFNVTTSGRDLILTIKDLPELPGSAGRITIGTDNLDSIYPLGVYPFIEVDDGTGYKDVTISVTSSNKDLVIGDMEVASYEDYGINLKAAVAKEVMSGRTNQELATIYIEEEIRGSLKEDQTIYFELPKGVKWVSYGTIETDGSTIISDSGYTAVSGSSRKIKNVFTATSSKPTSLAFKNMKVSIEPWFEGPLEVTVSGNADVGGKVTAAGAIQPVTLTVEGVTNVAVGAMKQKAGDIIITEAKSGAILNKANHNQLFITLPKGVTFAAQPTVAVTSGDLDLGKVEIGASSIATVNDGLLIEIKSDSSKPSVIKISDIYLTLDRTVPQGIVQAKFEGSKDFNWADGSTALVDFATKESLGSVGIATTVTASQGGAASFIIGSRTYSVGESSQMMDVAPYIKDSRSFVPVRYLAENMLGATVVWNEADQEVVLTKGGVEVVLTIGSKTYTVNGAEKTADVAPEIVDSRTFLPARYVAEAFGATVSWNEGTQTVLIQR